MNFLLLEQKIMMSTYTWDSVLYYKKAIFRLFDL